MRIGILGSGDVAKSLAKGFIARKDGVRLGTRTGAKPEVDAWTAAERLPIRQGSFHEVSAWAEAVVLATRGMANEETLRSAGPPNFQGKVVIDATNPLIFTENAPPGLGIGLNNSAGETVQRLLPKARVVKAFNTIGHLHMVRPNFPSPPTMFICGNDASAKEWVEQLLRDFGWSSIIDIGGIEGSRLLEPLCALWVTAGIRRSNWNIAFRLEERPAAGDGR
ncbi:MAG: NADPH-dependent F420 reductase [Thermoplasmata archaeon]